MFNEVQIDDSAGQARTALVARLQSRSTEIEEGVRTRVNAIGGPAEIDDPEYLHGLRAAVRAAIGYGLAAIESDQEHPPPIPAAPLTQARLAARYSIGLETVMRRYVAGRDALSKFVIEEVERTESREVGLTSLLESLGAAFECLLAEVGEEYKRESRGRPDSPRARQAKRVERLLAGEQLDVSNLGYDLGAHHLGLVTEGEGAPSAVRDLARALDGRLLLIHPTDDIVWAWIGFRRPVPRDQLDHTLAASWPDPAPLALGEIGAGISGWRLTNNQARSVFSFALSGQCRVARYVDDALLTSMARDEVLTASLREIYIAPLESGRDGGAMERQTLGAYFAAGRNGNTAAAALGVSRQTVSNRLRSVEGKIGRPLLVCATDLELALRLADQGLI